MSEKQIEKNKKKIPAHTWISVVVICLMIPVVLLASRYFGNRKYYLCSMVLIILSMVPFFLSFEKRKPEAREIVTLAVMCAIAVASRAAFIMRRILSRWWVSSSLPGWHLGQNPDS